MSASPAASFEEAQHPRPGGALIPGQSAAGLAAMRGPFYLAAMAAMNSAVAAVDATVRT